MPTPPTFDALYDAVKSEIQTRNPDLTDYSEGSALDGVTGGMAMGAEESVRHGISMFRSTFLDTAEGDDLDAVIADRYPSMDPRIDASAAVVTLTFTRGSSTGVLEIPAGTTVRGTVNGVSVSFTTDEAGYMAAADDAVDVIATCTATGTGGNVAVGVLTTIVDTIPDDATATVTNDERAVGGAAEESDDELRARARAYHPTLRRATVAALEVGALTVPGVRFVTVDESFIAPDDGGYVGVYIGDPDARGNAALAAKVDTALDDYRAAGVDIRVSASDREEIAATLTIYVRAGSDVSVLVSAARAAVLAYANSLAPGETLYVSRVEAAACSVSSNVLGCEVSLPTADTAPTVAYYAVRFDETALAITAVSV